MGCYNILGDGKKIRFWHEVVLGDCPLKIRFNNLFQICNQQNWVVAKVLEWGWVKLSIKRNFGNTEVEEWGVLMSCITEVYLNNEKDSMRWCLTKNGQFTTASLYQHCSFWRVVDIRMEEMWNTKLPLKVKNFPWLLYHERIQAAEAMER
jgi:hypothetical protein